MSIFNLQSVEQVEVVIMHCGSAYQCHTHTAVCMQDTAVDSGPVYMETFQHGDVFVEQILLSFSVCLHGNISVSVWHIQVVEQLLGCRIVVS